MALELCHCDGALELPHKPCNGPATPIHRNIPPVPDGISDQVWPEPFKKNGPDDEDGGSFDQGRIGIDSPKVELAIKPEQNGQRAGNQEQVVEPVMQERRGKVRL